MPRTEAQAPVVHRAHHIGLQAKHGFDHRPGGPNQVHVQCHGTGDAWPLHFYCDFHGLGVTARAAIITIVGAWGWREGSVRAKFGFVHLPQ